MARDIGGTGFTSLGDYLNANQDPLNAQYAADSTSAHGIGDTFNAAIGQVAPDAQQRAMSGTPADPGTVAGYNDAVSAGTKATEMGRKFGSEAGLAGAGANPVSGEQSFNAALEWGSHGGDYKNLSGYLGGFTPGAADAAYAQGTGAGLPKAPAAQPSDLGGPSTTPWVGGPHPWGHPGPDPGNYDPNYVKPGYSNTTTGAVNISRGHTGGK